MTTYLKLNDRREFVESLIKNYVYSPLGVDINNIEELPPQMELTEFDIYQALMIFYTHHPITNVISKDLILRTNGLIDLNLAKPNSDDSWEFIGIVGEGIKYNFTSNLLDTRLLGIPRNFFFVDPLQQSYVNSAINQNIGSPEYFVDLTNNTIRIITGGQAIIALTLGWMSTDLSMIRRTWIEGIAKLASIPLYERIIAIRDQVKVSDPDFSVNADFLKSKYTKIIEESKEWLKKIKPRPVLLR